MNTSQTSSHTTAHTFSTASTRSSNRTATGTRTARAVLAGLVATALTAAVVAQPAAARQDRGELVPSTPDVQSGQCLLQRVGTEFVRCDDLTGNGVPAPGWVEER